MSVTRERAARRREGGLRLAQLQQVVQGQAERNVIGETCDIYLSKVRVMCAMLHDHSELREEALVIENGIALKHIGKAHKVYVLKLPMSARDAKLLFAAISIDKSLPKKKRMRVEEAPDEIDDGDGDNELLDTADDGVDDNTFLNPGADLVTVSSQTYQNYKSALKWWHQYDCPSMAKIGYPWPSDVEMGLKSAIATYKRDIGSKKRRGVMKQKEGKDKYNLFGYITICKHFMKMHPVGNHSTFAEGLFAANFTKFAVATMLMTCFCRTLIGKTMP